MKRKGKKNCVKGKEKKVFCDMELEVLADNEKCCAWSNTNVIILCSKVRLLFFFLLLKRATIGMEKERKEKEDYGIHTSRQRSLARLTTYRKF